MTTLLPQDKANHFFCGAMLAAVASILYGPWLGLSTSIAAGVIKEALDYLANRRARAAGLPAPHGVELWDALATVAGGVVVAASHLDITLLINWAINHG